jgi:predicted hydrocarbon binding protein
MIPGEVIPEFGKGDPVAFFRYMLSIFRSEAMHLGINVDPVFFRTGMKVGEILSSVLTAGSTEDLVAEMNRFWELNGLGSIRLVQSDPVVIQVEGCFECKDLPVTGHGACAFDTGVLMKIFRKHLGVPVIVSEEECYSSGFDHCRFRIQPEQAGSG